MSVNLSTVRKPQIELDSLGKLLHFAQNGKGVKMSTTCEQCIATANRS